MESLLSHKEVKCGRKRVLKCLVHWKRLRAQLLGEPRSNLLMCNRLIRDCKSPNGLPLDAWD